ncbi:hypothetical protein HMPREF3156_02871 [Neisseria sp. HMSC06F02]|nr:hypothetical protein HMPREF3156_02871 [Neisseria sp. HMSC06F02]
MGMGLSFLLRSNGTGFKFSDDLRLCFFRGLSPRYVCCIQTERRFKFSDDLWGCIRIPVSDKYPDNVGFENPTYVFGFVRGQSPRYVCCVQTGWWFKFQTTIGAVGRILESDSCYVCFKRLQ